MKGEGTPSVKFEKYRLLSLVRLVALRWPSHKSLELSVGFSIKTSSLYLCKLQLRIYCTKKLINSETNFNFRVKVNKNPKKM